MAMSSTRFLLRSSNRHVADGMLYLLSERHEVALAEATPEGYREHGRFKIPDHGRRSWAHPVVTGGVLYIRDQQSLTAYKELACVLKRIPLRFSL